MKRIFYTVSVILFGLMLLQGCKKGDRQGMDIKSGDIIKYAKFSTAAYKDQELNTWGATLSKTEPVKLIEKLNVQTKGSPKGTLVEVAKVKLSDNTELFLQAKNLADKPVVFIQDTKAFVRNNASSNVFAIIPKGTIGFVLQENGEWIQVYVGQVDGKWVTQQWVNSGFTAEEIRVQEAKLFEESAAVLKNPSAKPDQKKQAEANLKNLTSSTGIFADMARSLVGLAEGTGDVRSDMNSEAGNMTASGTAKVQATAGLTMRETPGTAGKSLIIIPDGAIVKIIQSDSREETIAEKTSIWYQVEWNGKKGWVFGGILIF